MSSVRTAATGTEMTPASRPIVIVAVPKSPTEGTESASPRSMRTGTVKALLLAEGRTPCTAPWIVFDVAAIFLLLWAFAWGGLLDPSTPLIARASPFIFLGIMFVATQYALKKEEVIRI